MFGQTPTGYASGSFGPTTAGRMDAYVDRFQVRSGPLGGGALSTHALPPLNTISPPRLCTPLALTRRRAGPSSCSPRATAPRCRQALPRPPCPAPPRHALPPLTAMNTTLSQAVTAACKKHGGFYLGSIGGPAAILAKNCIKKVEVLEYPELGMEAVWRIEVEDFPAFVVVDDKGTNGALCTARVVGPRFSHLCPLPLPPLQAMTSSANGCLNFITCKVTIFDL